MSKKAQAFDGRESMAFILEPDGTEKTSGSLSVGDVGYITAKASASSIFGSAPVNTLFIAPASVTLASGDKFKPCSVYFLGFANDKSLSFSKQTNEATCDYDTYNNYTTNGIVSMSGSIAGFSMVEMLDETAHKSGINLIKKRFTPIAEISASGSVTYAEAKTADKDNLLILWNIRSAETGDLVTAHNVPVLFSNLSLSAANGSTQPFSVDYQGNDCDENGYKACNVQFALTAALRTVIDGWIARPAA